MKYKFFDYYLFQVEKKRTFKITVNIYYIRNYIDYNC